MTPIADMVERMLASGAAHDVIVLAVRTAETVTTRHVDRHDASRSKEAERAARYREKLKRDKANAEANDAAKANAQGVTPSRRDRDDAPTLLPSCSLNLEGSSEKGSKQKKKEGTEIARARGTRMVSGAQLTERFRQAAIELGAAPAVIAEMWAEHVDFWVGVPGDRGVKTEPNGWIATWRNDVRRKLKMGTYNGQRPHHPRRQSGADDFFTGLASVAADIDGHRDVAGQPDDDPPFRGKTIEH